MPPEPRARSRRSQRCLPTPVRSRELAIGRFILRLIPLDVSHLTSFLIAGKWVKGFDVPGQRIAEFNLVDAQILSPPQPPGRLLARASGGLGGQRWPKHVIVCALACMVFKASHRNLLSRVTLEQAPTPQDL